MYEENTMLHVLASYETFLIEVKRASANTVASYMRDLRQFEGYLLQKNMELKLVNRETIVDYTHSLQEKGKSSATISRSVASLKSLFQYMIAQNLCDSNPVTNIQVEKAEKKLGYPMFVKPSRAGSSVGVSKVKSADGFDRALLTALGEDDKVLIEEAILGVEVEVAVLEEKGRYTVAHPAEIDSGSAEFYDYETKYVSDASSFYLPARLSAEKQDEVRGYAQAIFKALDCRGYARVDFFYTPEGEFVFNEINTLPGFTPISMYPKMMINEGISYGELLDRLIKAAL